MKLTEATELSQDEFVRDWGAMGDKLKVSLLLDNIFKTIENDNDMIQHNYFLWHLNELLGDNGDKFKTNLLTLIENLSVRSAENGKEER